MPTARAPPRCTRIHAPCPAKRKICRAIVIGDVGISASGTADAFSKLPAQVTFALMPYGVDLEKLAQRAIYIDDGASSRSVVSQIAGSQNLPFAKADVVLDATPTPVEIDRSGSPPRSR